MAGAHSISVRVYYEDTDFSGVVYHASYLRFMERGRTELIRALGIEQRELFDGDAALGFAVRRMLIDFVRPAVMDDLLTVETKPTVARGATMELDQRILRGEEVLITAQVKVACVGGGKARRIPDVLRHRLGLEII
ncbi:MULTISPECIES: tol-pal system-associated acyl-CoA thioesterase [unclassified Bosea (in: a-proteobacteria)]|uniref:tol-pal system-associated acyl-CoA thioesterase n=1 Tax=unclassified Bosea (in: a-proteobacteria) TaxID=2653178 RepID=UPI000F75BD7E|nr:MULTISPECIES: tol-pal system-associated acyl-CoA thioesterase [unclassified Bosea (in: a-proteobacteria)]AZO81103.1 tol-pal system-associated acyl-CoA thioesterase [Bosea sp. Tri-49]RXT26069.1 tol-pal system-associated acyl-CoA thioesterase [Bosea sp. Tri-39]RXT31311.1 tol-pal system-associated acyl-CoA thioesterase [Bosea sp. Tri-54]